jgi:hypothetical protein
MKKIWNSILVFAFASSLYAADGSSDSVEDRTLLLEGAYKKIQRLVVNEKDTKEFRTDYLPIETFEDLFM